MQRGRCPKKLVAWSRWQAGAGPELNGERLWESGATRDYCRECRAAGGCEAIGKTCAQPQLLPEALPSVQAYGVCETQWSVGMAGRTGLRYEGCIPTLSLYLPDWQQADPERWSDRTVPDLLRDVQLIERAMLTADSEQRDKQRATAPVAPPQPEAIRGPRR